jgi:type I restriction enzyme S subunit
VSAIWPSKALAEVCEIRPPKGEAKRKLKDEDLVSFVPMEDLGIDQKFFGPSAERQLSQVAGSYTYFADGDVLLAKITPCFENGKLGIAKNLTNGIGFGSSEYFVFRPGGELSNEYLYYFLLQDSFRANGIKTMSGAVGHKRVSKEFIERSEIPLPPLPEQQRIVAILDDAFAGLATATANAEKNLRNAHELFESYLGTTLGQTGERWPVRRLEEIVDERCSLSYGIVQPGDEEAGGLPIVRPVDMTTKIIRVDGLKRIDASLAKAYGRTRLRGGELLLCVRGTTGAVSIAADELDGANVTRGIVPIHFNSSLLTQQFGYYALCSERVQRQVRDKTYGTALMQINIRDLRNLLIPIPSIAEQERVATGLDALSQEALRLREIYQSKLNDLQTLKQSLLQKAFSGELTSPPSRAIKEAAE